MTTSEVVGRTAVGADDFPTRIAGGEMNALRVLKRCWQALPLSDHNRWRLTVLILEPILPFIRGSVVHTAYLREKEWQTKRIRPFYGDPLPDLPPQEKPDIIVWGVIDWRLRFQRPQHLARGLAAAGHRVFYVSTSFINTRRPGFELERMDDDGRLYSVRFHLRGRPPVYAAPPANDDLRRLKESLAKLLEWTESRGIVSLVQHPYWHTLARKLPNSRMIYDCMDHHGGFANTGEEITAAEVLLFKEAEAVVTTSQRLHDIAATHNPRVTVIRNAAEAGFFAAEPATRFRDPQGRRVIGYYGAIAEWMDVELLEKLARHFPDCLLLLVGADEGGVRQRLAALPNVQLTGEVGYTSLPFYLYGMDVCLLPFRVTPLTLATNPVKVYEYLAAGKPVVSIALPELMQFGDLAACATTHDEFIAQVEKSLAETDAGRQSARKEFAAQNTWQARVRELVALIERLPE